MPTGRYDVVIVGAGAAGSVLAARLSEDADRNVLLIEAGAPSPRYAELSAEDDLIGALVSFDHLGPHNSWFYEGRVSAEIPRPVPVVRGKGVGGSSVVNGAFFLRGLREDYDAWGSPLWAWDRVLESFRRLECDADVDGHLHGDTGPIPVRRMPEEEWGELHIAFQEAALQVGFEEKPDMNASDGSGIGPMPRNSRDGRRVAVDHAYLGPAHRRPNLTILSEAPVRRVVIDRGRAVGVEAVVDGEPRVIEGDEIILSAGALASPHLLMLSGVGPAEVLRRAGIAVVADRPGVGANLRDHPALILSARMTAGPEPRAGTVTHNNVLSFTAPGSSARNDIQVLPEHTREDPTGLKIVCALQRPGSSGRIVLNEEEPEAPPVIDFGYLNAPEDGERLVAALRACQEILAAPAFERYAPTWVKPTPADLAGDAEAAAFVRDNLISLFHSCGTCRMGAGDDGLAVVDDHGRVHGVEGLRVLDLSIVPDNVRANPHATALMLGEHASALIRDAPAVAAATSEA